MLNADKTELLAVRPPIHRNLTEEMIVNIDGCIITDSPIIGNLGVIFDSQLTLMSQIKAATKIVLKGSVVRVLRLAQK